MKVMASTNCEWYHVYAVIEGVFYGCCEYVSRKVI